MFAMLMRTRVPKAIEGFSKYQSIVLREMLAMKLADDRTWNKLQEDHPELLKGIKREELNPEHFEFNTDDVTKSMLLDSVMKGASTLLEMNWTFMYSKGEDYFITFDNPYYLSNNGSFKGERTLGHLDKRNIVTLPIGTNTCFSASYLDLPEILEIPTDVVKEVNLFILSQFKQSVFSTKKTFLGDEYLPKE